MSDTPRTDAAVAETNLMAQNCVAWTEAVSADFARKLERKVAAQQAEIERLREDAERWAWYVSNPAWESEAFLGSALPHEVEAVMDARRKERP